MSEEENKPNETPQPISPWQIPQFQKLTQLAEALEKMAGTEIKLTQDKLDKLTKLLEIKKQLDEMKARSKK